MLQHADRALVNGGEYRLSQQVAPCLRATDEAPARLLPFCEIAFKPLVRSPRQKRGETGVVFVDDHFLLGVGHDISFLLLRLLLQRDARRNDVHGWPLVCILISLLACAWAGPHSL